MTESGLMTREEAAAYLRVKPQTLAVWKTMNKYNLPVVKVGSKVFYRQTDLDAWLNSRIDDGNNQTLYKEKYK